MTTEVVIPTVDELCDAEPDDSIGDGTLYEHYRFTADAGQQLLRVDKFLVAVSYTHLNCGSCFRCYPCRASTAGSARRAQ